MAHDKDRDVWQLQSDSPPELPIPPWRSQDHSSSSFAADLAAQKETRDRRRESRWGDVKPPPVLSRIEMLERSKESSNRTLQTSNKQRQSMPIQAQRHSGKPGAKIHS